jgi:membrane protein implicated in regulation of membrane protease activity
MRTAWSIIRRLWNVVLGLLMVALSLLAQCLFGFFFLMACAGIAKWIGVPNAWDGVVLGIAAFAVIAVNLLSFYEYFVRRRSFRSHGPEGQLLVAKPTGPQGILIAIFLMPRGIDRIVFGRERF